MHLSSKWVRNRLCLDYMGYIDFAWGSPACSPLVRYLYYWIRSTTKFSKNTRNWENHRFRNYLLQGWHIRNTILLVLATPLKNVVVTFDYMWCATAAATLRNILWLPCSPGLSLNVAHTADLGWHTSTSRERMHAVPSPPMSVSTRRLTTNVFTAPTVQNKGCCQATPFFPRSGFAR